MKLKSISLPLVVLGIFWGIIGISMATGVWEAKMTSEQVVVESPEDIKGWMTLKDISGYFNISEDELKKVFGLSAEVGSGEKIKEIAEENGKETDDYRQMLSEHLGIRYTSTEAENGEKSGEASVPAVSPQGTNKSQGINKSADGTSDGGAKTGEDQEIKGRMTLKEVEEVTKVPASYICGKLGIPSDVSKDAPLRDLGEQYGFEVQAIRDIVANYKK